MTVLAGGRGFEPLYRGPEPRVLPLDDPPEGREVYHALSESSICRATPAGRHTRPLASIVVAEPKDEKYQQHGDDYEVESTHDRPDVVPVFAQEHADVRKGIRPDGRTEERVEHESPDRDARRARGERDERTDDGKEPRPERDLESVPLQPAVRLIVLRDSNDVPL